jgi:hypothetical protein
LITGDNIEDTSMMPLFTALFILCMTVSVSSAETLKQVLLAKQIPITSFQESELNQNVQSLAAIHNETVFLAYNAEPFVGPIHLAAYDRKSDAMLRSDLQVDRTDVCYRGAVEVSFVAEFILLSTSVSPSAECLFVLDDKLQRRQTLYGFSPVEVAPEQIVLIEDMIHFAPVHPERLQLADLRSGATEELYPPKNDLLRAELAREHAKHMPSEQTCARMNDPCEPDEFDEDISMLGTDGKGRFALIASRSANHATKEEEPLETVAAQTVLYIYQRDRDGWRYCQEKIDDSVIERLRSAPNPFDHAAARCTPNLPVIPDMSTVQYNPFLDQSKKH